jgi:CIC family chloride channel protein
VARPLFTKLLRLRLWLNERLRPGEVQLTLFWAGLIGAIGGLSSPAFNALTTWVQWLLTGDAGDLVATAAGLPWWRRMLVPALGGLAAGLVLQYGVRIVGGRKATDYMEAVTLGDGVIRTRPSLVRMLSSVCSIGSGGSIGREGPMVQLAALVASSIGRAARMPRPRLRLLVACGAAAGIASAYNAPIGGALFVAEIVLGSIAMETFGPLIFASVMSTVVARFFFGGEPLFQVPRFTLVSYFELAPYILLGALAGAFAPWFLRLLDHSGRFFSALPVPLWARMALGGLLVGLLSIQVPDVWGNGYNAVTVVLSTNLLWTSLLVLLAFKLLATAATVGSGAVGGVFTPTLLVGAILGGLVGTPVHAWFPDGSGSANAYALVGMGALLAATTHAPLMAILILFEMTLDYDIVLPLMLACVVAHAAAKALRSPSIYGSVARAGTAGPAALDGLRVRDLMKAEPPCVPLDARFSQIVEKFVGLPYQNLYVVGAQREFRGVIPLQEIKPYLYDVALAQVAIAEDLLREEFPSVHPDTTLRETLARFQAHAGERLPVVEEGTRRLVGSVSKSDLLITLSSSRY